MKTNEVNKIMDNITNGDTLEIIREALTQYGNKELTTNLKDDSTLLNNNVCCFQIDENRNGNLNLVTMGSHPKTLIEFQNNDAQ